MPRPLPSRLETTRLVTEAEVTSWVRTALPGSAFVYCTGPFVPEGPTKARVTALMRAEVVFAHHRRVDGVLNFYIVKRPDPASVGGKPWAPPRDEAAEAIFAALQRCVERRRPAYSLLELARIAGLATREQARHRLGKLEAAGRIRTVTEKAGDGTSVRIVTIAGRSTALPQMKGA